MQNVNTNETNLSGRVTTVPLVVVVPGDDDRDWEQTEMP